MALTRRKNKFIIRRSIVDAVRLVTGEREKLFRAKAFSFVQIKKFLMTSEKKGVGSWNLYWNKMNDGGKWAQFFQDDRE